MGQALCAVRCARIAIAANSEDQYFWSIRVGSASLMELQAAFYKHKLEKGFLSQHAPRAVCNACTHYKQLMSILQRWAKYIF